MFNFLQRFRSGTFPFFLTVAGFLVFVTAQVGFAATCVDPDLACQDSCIEQANAVTDHGGFYTTCYSSCTAKITQSQIDAYNACMGTGTTTTQSTTNTTPASTQSGFMTTKIYYVGKDLKMGQDVTTGPNELAIVQFEDGSKMMVGRNSTFRFDTTDNVEIQEHGQFAFSIKKALNRVFGVKLPSANTPFAMAVRGTVFLVDTTTPNAWTEKTLEGVVDVTGSNKMVTVNAGYQVTMNQDGTVNDAVNVSTASDSWYKTLYPFTDVAPDHVFYNAVFSLKNGGIVQGYADGTFKPLNQINRAEFAKIVIAAVAPNATGSNCFSDVKNEWFAPYVCYAKQNNIIGGYPDGTFKPGSNINLAEGLKIVMLALKVNLSSNKGTNWYDVYLNTANEKGILTSINPDVSHLLNRGEMSQLIFALKNSL